MILVSLPLLNGSGQPAGSIYVNPEMVVSVSHQSGGSETAGHSYLAVRGERGSLLIGMTAVALASRLTGGSVRG